MRRVGRRGRRRRRRVMAREAGGEEAAVRGALDHRAGGGPPEVAGDVSSDAALRTGTWLRFFARRCHEISHVYTLNIHSSKVKRARFRNFSPAYYPEEPAYVRNLRKSPFSELC